MKLSHYTILSLLILSILISLSYAVSSSPFDSKFKWETNIDKAKDRALIEKKPLAVLMTKGYCGACKNLKRTINEYNKDTLFDYANNNYIMVHLSDDNVPDDPQWAPDGGYIPRVIFMDSNGTIRSDITNTKRTNYVHFYHNAETLEDGLKDARSKLH